MRLLKKYAVLLLITCLSVQLLSSCEEELRPLDPRDLYGLWSENASNDQYTFEFRPDQTGSTIHYINGRIDFIDGYLYTVYPDTWELRLSYSDGSYVFYDILDLDYSRLVIRDQDTGMTFYLYPVY